MPQGSKHIPVLLKEVLQFLKPVPGDVVIDATLGGGGHAEAFIAGAGSKGKFLGIDADLQAIDRFKRKYRRKNVAVIRGNFRNIDKLAREAGFEEANVIFFDFGLSSDELDDPERGFSFQKPGPLDMRMNRDKGSTAADLVNGLGESEIAQIIREYGEEFNAARIARAIVKSRAVEPITRTEDLF